MNNLRSYTCFHEAATQVMERLHERIGFDLWMVTRTQEDDWIVLASHDKGYDVAPGKVFRWTDSFCSRMVLGLGPQIAPSSLLVSAYAEAPIAKQVKIGAYIGVPILLGENALFGTLCAVDPEPQPESIVQELPIIQLCARLLSTILQSELIAEDATRKAEQALNDCMIDELTGLYNRRGWDQLLAAEESRCKRYGSSAAVFALDLDGLKTINDTYGHARGDELLQRLAGALRTVLRTEDVVARVGGDEFAVLVAEGRPLDTLEQRLKKAFEQASIQVSMAYASRGASSTLEEAWEKADAAMYAIKRAKPGHRNEGYSSVAQQKSACGPTLMPESMPIVEPMCS